MCTDIFFTKIYICIPKFRCLGRKSCLGVQLDISVKASAKRPQHFNVIYPNIVGPAFASPGQRISTQHCWAQHVACVWPTCYGVLRHVRCCKSNYCACLGATLLHEAGQTNTTSCNIHTCCMKNLTIFKLAATKPNMLQHVTRDG